MSDIRLHTTLLELPLFLGMSRGDIADIVAHTKFGFAKFGRGKTVINEGDVCDSIYILISGEINVQNHADDYSYSVTESLEAPAIIQPERIFGLIQRYSISITANRACSFIRLQKAEVLRLSEQYEIFRLNLLNIISTQGQRISRLPWHPQPHDIHTKLIRFFFSRCQRPTGSKTFSIKMETLAHEISESRLNVSRELNRLHNEGLISITRGIIFIPALERLMNV